MVGVKDITEILNIAERTKKLYDRQSTEGRLKASEEALRRLDAEIKVNMNKYPHDQQKKLTRMAKDLRESISNAKARRAHTKSASVFVNVKHHFTCRAIYREAVEGEVLVKEATSKAEEEANYNRAVENEVNARLEQRLRDVGVPPEPAFSATAARAAGTSTKPQVVKIEIPTDVFEMGYDVHFSMKAPPGTIRQARPADSPPILDNGPAAVADTQAQGEEFEQALSTADHVFDEIDRFQSLTLERTETFQTCSSNFQF